MTVNDNSPTIERGSFSDRAPLEQGRPDGVGKPSDDQPIIGARVAIPAGSPKQLKNHAAEISSMVGATAHYGGHGTTHPATGSPIPNQPADDDFDRSGVDQQTKPDKDND
jgi:hypothetical protein